MKTSHLVGVAAIAIGIALFRTPAISQTAAPTQGPAAGGSPAWFLQGSFADPGGRTIVDPDGRVTIPARDGAAARGAAPAAAPAAGVTPGCTRSPLCGKRRGISRQALQRV